MININTEKRKCKGKIKSAGTNPAEIFSSDCILPDICYKNRICEEFLPGGCWRGFSLFVVGIAWGSGGRKSTGGDLTGRPVLVLSWNPTGIPTLVYNLSSHTTHDTLYLFTTPIPFRYIPLTHDTLYSSLQTPSKTKDPHTIKAQSPTGVGAILCII